MNVEAPPKPRHLSLHDRRAYQRLENVIGCKWSAGIVAALGHGVRRPGELERYIPGISTKVLNERLRRLRDYGLISRTEFPGLPLRVEYDLTPVGVKLAAVIDQVRALSQEHHRPETALDA